MIGLMIMGYSLDGNRLIQRARKIVQLEIDIKGMSRDWWRRKRCSKFTILNLEFLILKKIETFHF